MESALRDHNIDLVVHFGRGPCSRSIDGPDAFIETNVVGTLFLQSCKAVWEASGSTVEGISIMFQPVGLWVAGAGRLAANDIQYARTLPMLRVKPRQIT